MCPELVGEEGEREGGGTTKHSIICVMSVCMYACPHVHVPIVADGGVDGRELAGRVLVLHIVRGQAEARACARVRGVDDDNNKISVDVACVVLIVDD